MAGPFSLKALFADPWATRLVLACAFVLHYVLGAAVGLSVDEAHYALYATHLALSYFDHPPLVGWVQWPLVALNAPVEVLRWIPELLWLGTALLVFQIAERLQAFTNRPHDNQRLGAGFWAVLAMALAPLLHVLGIGLLPDTLLMFFTALLMWQTLGLMAPGATASPARWLALGLVLGLAGLSKYTAIFAALAVAACLLAAHGLRLLRSPWPWVAVAAGGCGGVARGDLERAERLDFLCLPNPAWQGRRLACAAIRSVFDGAVVWPMALCCCGAHRGGGRCAPRRRAHCRCSLCCPLSYWPGLSGGGSSLPHWTAPAWVALAPLAGVGLVGFLQRSASAWRTWVCWRAGRGATGHGSGLDGPDGERWRRAVAHLRAALTRLRMCMAGSRPARALLVLAQQQGLQSVSVQNWTLASRIGWYARPLPVHVLEDRFDQFDFWAGDLPQGGSTLLVDWSQMAYEVPHALRMGLPTARCWKRCPVRIGGARCRLSSFMIAASGRASPNPG